MTRNYLNNVTSSIILLQRNGHGASFHKDAFHERHASHHGGAYETTAPKFSGSQTPRGKGRQYPDAAGDVGMVRERHHLRCSFSHSCWCRSYYPCHSHSSDLDLLTRRALMHAWPWRVTLTSALCLDTCWPPPPNCSLKYKWIKISIMLRMQLPPGQFSLNNPLLL